jgi:hypothetical protein
LGATGAIGAQGAQGDTGPPAGVTCYSFDMWLDPTQPGICAGAGRRTTVWSQSVSCSTVTGCYYQNETNCQNSLPDLDTYYACTSGVPPTWGQLQSSCNIANGACGRSDERLKRGIETLSGSLEKIMKIDGVTYDRIDDSTNKRHTGVLAQQVLEVLPEAVLGAEHTTYSVAYGNMAGLFIEAIKELKKENDELRDILKRNNLI